MNNIIEIKDVTKEYNDFKLGPINLQIPSGTIIGLIGENGAGKTTLIKLILSIIEKQSGVIQIFNKDTKEYDNIIKEDIGVVLDNMFFPELLAVKDINNIMKSIYKKWDEKLFAKYLADFKINPKQTIKNLSKGMRKKVEIATSLAHHPKLLILDEPTSGLDPVVRSEILDIFLNFIQDEEHTILLSTHITSDLEHIADYIVFLDNGQIILNETKDEILNNFGILKCGIDDFLEIETKDIIAFKKYKYNYDILIKNLEKMSKKYQNFIIDKITLEELMVLMIKGEK